MKTYTVPHTDLEVSSVVLGLMRIAKMENAEIRALFDAAVEAGITVFDHADVYGGARHRCEERFGEAVPLNADDRARILIQSKVGIRSGYFDFSRENILEGVDGSLKAL
jgi:predicted oxidoreductase